MPPADLIGLVAASFTTASFLPQAILVLRTRNTDGISLVMYAMFVTGVALWFAYGLLIRSMPVIVANIITFALAACILVVKYRNFRRERMAAPMLVYDDEAGLDVAGPAASEGVL